MREQGLGRSRLSTAIFFIVWSPNGEEIAFTRLGDHGAFGDSKDYLIAITSEDGGGLRQLISSDAFDESAIIHSPTWSGDGERIAFVVQNNVRTSDGRNVAGVHWRSDGIEGLKLGEAVAMQVLPQLRITYPEHFGGFRLTKFNGAGAVI